MESKRRDGVLGLVALEVADGCQTPRPICSILRAGFLDLVFAGAGEAGAHGFLDGFDGLGLADGEEFDFGRIATGLRGSYVDSIFDSGET